MTTTVKKMLLDFLHITYTPDSSTESRLANEADDGLAFIRKHCDPNATCEPSTEYAGMLCEYVLRAESGARATFEEDFAGDIVGGLCSTQAKDYAEAMGYDSE